MKRRAFVRRVAIGTFGISLVPMLEPFPFFKKSGVELWLAELVKATEAKRRSNTGLGATNFQKVTTKLNAYFAERGYGGASAHYYFYGEGGNCCFYPLFLQHTRSGIIDFLVPVLIYGADGTWRHNATLTGYQLEALVRAAPFAPLADLLLTSGQKTADPALSDIYSKAPKASITTRFYKGEAETSITIHVLDKEIFHDTFKSRHCLTAMPTILPQSV